MREHRLAMIEAACLQLDIDVDRLVRDGLASRRFALSVMLVGAGCAAPRAAVDAEVAAAVAELLRRRLALSVP